MKLINVSFLYSGKLQQWRSLLAQSNVCGQVWGPVLIAKSHKIEIRPDSITSDLFYKSFIFVNYDRKLHFSLERNLGT